MAAKLLLLSVVLSSLLCCDVAKSQDIDFSVALRRSPSAPSRGAFGAEPDWSSALQRRSVAHQPGELPASWDQAILRAALPATVAKKPFKAAPLVTSSPGSAKTEQCLFFTAPWCTYCDTQKQYLSPRIAKLGLTMGEQPDADFRMIDIERNRSLQTEYGVKSLPCLVYLQSGLEVDRVTGFDRARLKTPQLTPIK